MAVNLITQAEYAKRRGVSQVAVHKAVKAGRISLIDGKVDPDVADVQWARNTRARAGSGGAAATPLERAAASAVSNAPDAAGDPDYLVSRAKREAAEAALSELRLAEQQGRLIDVAVVRSHLSSLVASTRDVLLQIPARLAPVLAVESDPAKVHDAIQTELHRALHRLVTAPELFDAAEDAPA